MFQGEFSLGSVTRISLPQNSVTIARNNLAGFESGPDVFLHSLIRGIISKLRLHFAQPDEDLLVGKTVEGAGQAVECSTISKEWVRQSRAD